MISSIGSAMAGMAAATQQLDRAATRVARDGGDAQDQGAERLAEAAFAADAAVVRTADAMVGTLINTVA
ncbi:MAG TPA: hypothetical protein VFP84_33335 [Kofleriaceae bacterium]|nr:hypothetical protein [Kofleriaceae bacterium]